jgi:hypothetical protein
MLKRLYAVNAALLLAHEIDSAYWKEWDLFGLPGGEPGFVLLHLPLVTVAFWGYDRLLAGARAGLYMSLALAAAGISALAIHGAFLAQGRPEFRHSHSLAILLAGAGVSLLQGVAALRAFSATRPLAG